MFSKLRTIILGLSALILAAGWIYIQTKNDSAAGSKGTLQPVDFAALTHKPSDENYLMCDTLLCPNAEADTAPVTLPTDVKTTRSLVAVMIDTSQFLTAHNYDFAINQFDILVKDPRRPFPSVLTLKLFETDWGQTEVIAYAYRPVGDNRKEENILTLRTWTDALAELAAKEDTP